MADARNLAFTAFAADADGVLVLFCDDKLEFGRAAQRILGTARNLVKRAAQAEKFTGKNGTLDLVMPAGLRGVQRLVVIGAGKAADIKPRDYVRLGGVAAGKIPATAPAATLVAELPGVAIDPEHAADLAMGATLRRYRFDRYKTKRKDGEEKPADTAIRIQVADPAAARGAWRRREGLAKGVILARDLINEPANVLHPEEFARRAQALRRLGVAVQVLGEREMRRLGMHALLGVGQGSERESQVVIMRWNGGRKSDAPVAFVGKGVCFDTGGISIKPAGGMEDMKGDMGGAACVVGLMQALATRKAKANVVGAIGLVENMPDGRAQRPGDIVKTMSGQTIEIVNTDAEGRLVLADVLHFVATRYSPKFIVDLATLTGAIMVSLGHEYAGMFANDDTLAQRLIEAGTETGERVWRMPLGPEYDKLIDSRFADMKNTGGRNGGAITAAQLLQRFVGKTPWAHLDIAGTAFGAPADDINKGWSAGWGVRLLDRLVNNNYESAKGK